MTTSSTSETGTTDNGTTSETGAGADSTTDTTNPETGEQGGEGDESTEEDGRLKKLRGDLNARDARIADLQAKVDAFEAEKLSDTEKVEKERNDLRTENTDLRRQLVAARYGLDEDMASRLRGETPEELEEDAKSLAEKFGKSEQEKTPSASAAGLGGGSRNDEVPTDPVEVYRSTMRDRRY